MFEKIKLLFRQKRTKLNTDNSTGTASEITAVNIGSGNAKPIVDSLVCPYCASTDFVRRGLRVKKLESVQLYLCKNCQKTFTPQSIHGKHYPLATIYDAISLYNLGYSLEESCKRVNEKHLVNNQQKTRYIADSLTVSHSDEATPGLSENSISINKNFVKSQNNTVSVNQQSGNLCIQPSTLSAWISEFKENLPFLRLRDFAAAKFKPNEMVETATLAHRQLYRYRFHRAKAQLTLQEHFHHTYFKSLLEFLELVPGECPHQYFSAQGGSASGGQDGLRASEAPLTFSKTAMIVRGKQNFATKLASFVLQGAKERKDRHEILQKFLLYNDSVTVATEVPVYLTRDDLLHMQTQLGFQIYLTQNSKLKNQNQVQSSKLNRSVTEIDRDLSVASLPKADAPIAEADIAEIAELPKLITGHIDILQIRNGQIHILDYKPNASRERPIEQLTLYAMALSRLTGLRLFEFKCAWFDEKDYFEFYPLHVLHKTKKALRRRKVNTIEGTYNINKNPKKIESIRAVSVISNC